MSWGKDSGKKGGGWGGDDWGKGGGAAWSGAGAGDGGWGKGGGKDDGWGKGGGKDKGYGKADPWAKGGGDKGYGKDPWSKGGGKDSWGGGKDSWGKDGGKGKGGKDKWGGGGGGGGEWMPEQSAYVKTWNEERGFGFVTVASGEDIYVHRTNLADGEALTKDAQVWVEAQWDIQKGKWAATRCSGASSTKGGGGDKGKGGGKDKGGKGKGGGKGKRGVDWMQSTVAWVKTWTEERGFGFVCTAEGEDIYVHRTSLQDGSVLTMQNEVTVDANWNWEKNKWHATKVTGASGDPPRAKTAGLETPTLTGSQGGTVKAWQEKGGYGFLVPDNGGPDVFCHSSALTEGTTTLHVGEAVVFDLQFDEKKGKYLAVSCSSNAVTGGGFGPAAKVKSADRSEPYNPEASIDAELAAQIESLS